MITNKNPLLYFDLLTSFLSFNFRFLFFFIVVKKFFFIVGKKFFFINVSQSGPCVSKKKIFIYEENFFYRSVLERSMQINLFFIVSKKFFY